ncbi:hypothetical protein L0222_21305, partial [bacterium]|nr:hypothetical protein [bacterium]
IRRLASDGFNQEDVNRAKSSFAGTTKIILQTNDAILSDLAANYFFGVGLDFTERMLQLTQGITLEQLRDAAKKHLSGDIYVFGIQRGKT